jgi:hypothetical protein
LASHPNQASVRRLAGEEAFRRGDFGRAADLLWEAMWINPTPPTSPAGFWRMTMIASERAGRGREAVAAALRALALVEEDVYLRPEDRRDLFRDCAQTFARRGDALTAAHLMALSGVQGAP